MYVTYFIIYFVCVYFRHIWSHDEDDLRMFYFLLKPEFQDII